MREYDFILKFRLAEASTAPGRFVDALAAGGCDDATVGIGRRGRIALNFTREARSALEAVRSAVRDVKRAIPGVQLVEAAPDFVGLSDVADLIGCTRRNIRKLMITNIATFPVAVHEGTQSLWHLRPVLDWFAETQKRSIDRGLVEVSGVTMKINIASDARRASGAEKDIEAMLA
ncbi:MAG: DNA-binding protein [Rhodanobacteraceae bacterium]